MVSAVTMTSQRNKFKLYFPPPTPPPPPPLGLRLVLPRAMFHPGPSPRVEPRTGQDQPQTPGSGRWEYTLNLFLCDVIVAADTIWFKVNRIVQGQKCA